MRTLRTVFPPRGETTPARDLWPDLARRISSPAATRDRMDWVLAGLAALWLVAFPRALGGLLYLL